MLHWSAETDAAIEGRVADILADLCEVLYPGYGRRQNLHSGNIGYYVGSLVDSLHDIVLSDGGMAGDEVAPGVRFRW